MPLSVLITHWLTLVSESICTWRENHMKHLKTPCGKNTNFYNFRYQQMHLYIYTHFFTTLLHPTCFGAYHDAIISGYIYVFR
jgi:hypothetical protein